MTKSTTVNFLRFIEAGPHRAGDRAVVAREKCICKIVSRAGFSSGRKFFQTELCARYFSCAGLKRIEQAGMHFVCGFKFNYLLLGALAIRVPDNRAIFLFDSFQNVCGVGSPAAIWENGVADSQFGERDLAAAQKSR